ncbi:GMC oxidoreductase-domain-containing protein [Panaeolus papilionaceus]|nr:GMC oxidoreductase-domain-containing protein [Panaeolus papilionaceus]
MWTLESALLTLAVLSAQTISATAKPGSHHARHAYADPNNFSTHAHLFKREIITSPSQLLSSYDFIIAGGGLAGLVLASRLSENDGTTVLVLEAGSSGDAVKDGVNAPAGAYYSSIVDTDYDWKHITVPQEKLNNRVIPWPRGKILGGSSAMNAMYVVRPSVEELDAWKDIIAPEGDTTAAAMWGWDNMFTNMKKAENFTAPNANILGVMDIQYDASTHGSGGPMQVSYPDVMINIVANWTASLNAAGVPTLAAPNGGSTLGGFISPSSINPANWTRSYSKSAYIDSLPPRSNLHILADATVTRLVFGTDKDQNGDLYAKEVEWVPSGASDASGRTSVKVKREVILAGGTMGSPKILMHSGVGPKDILDAAGVQVALELPGVGQNLQDHMTAGIAWETPLETAGDIQATGSDFSRSAEFLSCINDAVAFVNISTLFDGNPALDLQKQIIDFLPEAANTLVPSTNSDIVEGYKEVYNTIANKFWEKTAHVEMLMSIISPGTVSIQSALQHPFSKGHLYINSSNPMDPIVIDPKYYSHFADVIIMRQGLKLVRKIGEAFGDTLGAEVWPGPRVQTDQDWENWLIFDSAGTQYHPMGSAAMMPRNKGGVVNAKLNVYGLVTVVVVGVGHKCAVRLLLPPIVAIFAAHYDCKAFYRTPTIRRL